MFCLHIFFRGFQVPQIQAKFPQLLLMLGNEALDPLDILGETSGDEISYSSGVKTVQLAEYTWIEANLATAALPKPRPASTLRSWTPGGLAPSKSSVCGR